MSDERAISRSVLADQVKDRLLQDILAGRYPPDSRIVETRVARELGTSQAPVREALRGLEALGRRGDPARSAGRGSSARRSRSSSRPTRCGPSSSRSGHGSAVPRMTDADLAELDDAQRGDAGAAALAATGTASPSPTRRSTAASCTSPATPPSSGCGDRSSPSRGPTSPSSPRAPTRTGRRSSTCHPRALRQRDAEVVVAALRRHFDEVRAHLAGGWRDQASTDDRRSASARRSGGRGRVTGGDLIARRLVGGGRPASTRQARRAGSARTCSATRAPDRP